MTSQTLGRFHIREHNELQYPHKCGTCGSFSGDNGKRYIDFDCFVEFYGTVYICTDCFLGATRELDLVPVESYKAAMDQIAELKAVVTTLINENRTLRDAVDSLRSFTHPHSDTYNVPDIPESVVETGSTESGSKQEDSSRDPGPDDSDVTTGETGSTKQTDGGRSEDVHDDGTHIGLNIFDI